LSRSARLLSKMCSSRFASRLTNSNLSGSVRSASRSLSICLRTFSKSWFSFSSSTHTRAPEVQHSAAVYC
jgi:hypothetical protein